MINRKDHAKKDKALKHHTYYQVGGTATSLFQPCSISELQNYLFFSHPSSLPLAVIGAGSNVIFSDEDFSGTVITCSEMKGWHWLSSSLLLCEAGISNTEIAEIGLEAGYSDAAWMYRMPGQFGATIRMNARCYGGEISQIVTDIFTLDLSGYSKHYSGSEVFIGYKDTLLMRQKEIVAAAIIQFKRPSAPAEILKIMEKCESDRHLKNHFLYPSCGSTFKNNYALGKPSGQIFDELRLKGTKVGGAEISKFHSNFIFNMGDAKSSDILSLARTMRSMALEQGMDLNLEVQPVGVFDKALAHDLAFEHLDADTLEIENNQVLTGVLSSGKKKPLPENNLYPKILCNLPFAGWSSEHSQDLGHVRFIVTQHLDVSCLRDLKSDSTDDPDEASQQKAIAKALTIEFIATSPTHLEYLLDAAPQTQGFQDKLWESSVFECFIYNKPLDSLSPDHSENPNSAVKVFPLKYTELEINSAENWLALQLESYRKRAPQSHNPCKSQFPGIQPFAIKNSHETKPHGLGFELSIEALSQLFFLNQGCARGVLFFKGAYANSKKKSFALAPKRSFHLELTRQDPDFHDFAGAIPLLSV